MVLHQGCGVQVSASEKGTGIVAAFFSWGVGFRAQRKGCQGLVLVARELQSLPHSLILASFDASNLGAARRWGEWVHLNSVADAITHLKTKCTDIFHTQVA